MEFFFREFQTVGFCFFDSIGDKRSSAGRCSGCIRIDFIQAKLCQQGGVFSYEFCKFLIRRCLTWA